MHRPVLVTPPEMAPVSLTEAKAHLRVEVDDDDALIEGLVKAATEHLDGWTGILGRCLVEQEWRHDFDAFARCLALPLGPVISITSITWRRPDGTLSTVASSNFSLVTDSGGRTRVRFKDGFALPTDLHESRAIAVTYKAGYETIPEVPAVPPGDGDPPDPPGSPAVPAKTTVPDPLKVAIMLMAGNWYEQREAVVIGTISSVLPMGVTALIAPYRRVGV